MSTPYPRLWWTADRSALVEEGDVRAAFLAHAGHEPVPAELAALQRPTPAIDAPSASTAPGVAPMDTPTPKRPVRRARK